jgi:DNA-binding CsgD family transcriptional regulator
MQVNKPTRVDTPPFPGASKAAADWLRRLGVSRRQAQVLGLVLAPYPNAQIARELGISKRTVESHVSALLAKFAVPDRPALIRVAAGLLGDRRPTTDARGRPRTVTERQLIKLRGDARATLRHVAAQQRSATLSRAIQRERDSIGLHEGAAQRLDDLAARWLTRARTATDERTRADRADRAAAAHERARAARSRAAEVRRRLRAEGINPDP